MRSNFATGIEPIARDQILPAARPLAFLFAATAPATDDESWLLATAGALQGRGHGVTIATVDRTSLAARAGGAGLAVLAMRPGRRFSLRARWRAGAIRKQHRFDVAIAFDAGGFDLAASIAPGPAPLFLRLSELDATAKTRRCLTHRRLTSLWLAPGVPTAPLPAGVAVHVLGDAVTIPAALPDPTAVRRELRLPRRVTLCLHVAPLERGYGHETLLRALQVLHKSGRPRPTVAFAGTGPEESNLHVLCQDLGVKESVLWLGFRRDIEPLVQAVDVVLAPEASANTRSVLLAAQAAGVLVLAADTAVAQQCSPEPGGRRIASTAPQAWADAIAQACADPTTLAGQTDAVHAAAAVRARAARAAVTARADAATMATELECAVHAARLRRASFARHRAALFVDRDGTLVENVPYNSDPDAVVLEPHVGRALHWLRDAGFAIVVVTNQSAVARGLCREADVQSVNDRIRDLLRAEGCELDGIYVCPHHPDYGPACDCRKPAPGLLHRAAVELRLDLAHSVLVGDSDRDLEAARRAGAQALFYRNPVATPAPDAGPVPAGIPVHTDWLSLASQLLAAKSRAAQSST